MLQKVILSQVKICILTTGAEEKLNHNIYPFSHVLIDVQKEFSVADGLGYDQRRIPASAGNLFQKVWGALDIWKELGTLSLNELHLSGATEIHFINMHAKCFTKLYIPLKSEE